VQEAYHRASENKIDESYPATAAMKQGERIANIRNHRDERQPWLQPAAVSARRKAGSTTPQKSRLQGDGLEGLQVALFCFILVARLAHAPAKWNPVRRQGHAPTRESTGASRSYWIIR
jgi:hypothetical protein